jgi:excisionase family DNA binding protein
MLGTIRLFNLRDIAKALDVSFSGIKKAVHKGELNAKKFGNEWWISEQSVSKFFNPS